MLIQRRWRCHFAWRGFSYETISCFRSSNMGLTLYDKLWDSHVVHLEDDGTALLYIDRHLVHEVTSPQAYEGLKVAGRKPWRVDSVVATADHNTPTTGWDEGVEGIRDPFAKLQIQTLDANIRHFGAKVYFPFLDRRQGIVHVIGPEQGATLPGMTVVCGDSHTSTHGAFACLAHGIGTSEVEHVLATQSWRTLKRDPAANVGGEVAVDARAIEPHITCHTPRRMVMTVADAVPDPAREGEGA